jgi:hypothetical protein
MMSTMQNQPDLTFYFAIHQAQRNALRRYCDAVATLTEHDRIHRGKAMRRWARGFTLELEEHHYVEDAFFFPSLRTRVTSAEATIDGLEAEHRRLDDILGRWPAISTALAEPSVSFHRAQADAVAFAHELREFIHGHLAVEDKDVLPLFWRHYTAAEYEVVQGMAIKKGRKAGMWFVAPFTVDCYTQGTRRAHSVMRSLPQCQACFGCSTVWCAHVTIGCSKQHSDRSTQPRRSRRRRDGRTGRCRDLCPAGITERTHLFG